MRTVPISRADLLREAAATADEFVDLVLSVPDPDAPVPATPGWSVTDVLGHVAREPARYRDLALGGGTWPSRVAELPAFNAEQVRTLPTRDPAKLAAILREGLDSLLENVERFGDDQPMMNFDGDQRVRADRALGTLIGEFVVHGHDIARAFGRPWPIRAELVPMILRGQQQILPGWVHPDRAAGHTATYEFRLRGQESYLYQFRDGHLVVGPPAPDRIDVHLSFEPVTALLLTYGRIGQLRAALTGKVFAWGRRPWLATRLIALFHPA
ncbi:maleylpyruvate isomerase N-terminal domain-containing protein [Amycolatopsis anabasis]|uniref:maleylpyruvate isomerase N-terminal domain-containing protein n=1 Tax=Amycolatopsis anabasis TaxID=1840409 RepID=UPI00131DF063|nr:maleylpyruvate isomerase N-terminal domain-containing protein [Amycolatopsis anabasis]